MTIGTEQELDTGISDADLFNEAGQDEQLADTGTPVVQQPAPAANEAPAPEPAKDDKAPAQRQEQDHRVPLRELLDERERRQQIAREMEEERRQRAELQRQIEALRNPQQPVDLLTDPQRYQETIEQRLERHQRELDQRMRVHSINTSFSFAQRQHGEDFQKAFAALEEAAAPHKGGDVMLRDRIVNSPDPGEAVMQWYRSRQILEESGGNLGAFKEKILKEQKEALLKDPAFLAEAMKAARAQAQANPTVRPSNPAGIPSLTRQTSAAPNAGNDDDGDMSDGALFRHAMAPRRR